MNVERECHKAQCIGKLDQLNGELKGSFQLSTEIEVFIQEKLRYKISKYPIYSSLLVSCRNFHV